MKGRRIAVALFLLATGALAQAPAGRLVPEAELRAAFATDVVLARVLDSRIHVERYAPGGTLRGRRVMRRWRIEADRMCTDPDGPGRICFALQVATGGPLVDHAALWLLLDNGFGTVSQAVFRRPAPPSPPRALRGQVIALWRDGMLVRPEGGGADVWVRSAPVRDLAEADQVSLHGRSDGVLFNATRGVRLRGPA